MPDFHVGWNAAGQNGLSNGSGKQTVRCIKILDTDSLTRVLCERDETSMLLSLTLWLLAGHSQTLTVTPQATVIVIRCKDNTFATLYYDERMIYPMPNPVWSNPTNNVSFVVGKSGCYRIFVQKVVDTGKSQ